MCSGNGHYEERWQRHDGYPEAGAPTSFVISGLLGPVPEIAMLVCRGSFVTVASLSKETGPRKQGQAMDSLDTAALRDSGFGA